MLKFKQTTIKIQSLLLFYINISDLCKMLPKNVTEYISRSLCQNVFLDIIRTFSLINILNSKIFRLLDILVEGSN